MQPQRTGVSRRRYAISRGGAEICDLSAAKVKCISTPTGFNKEENNENDDHLSLGLLVVSKEENEKHKNEEDKQQKDLHDQPPVARDGAEVFEQLFVRTFHVRQAFFDVRVDACHHIALFRDHHRQLLEHSLKLDDGLLDVLDSLDPVREKGILRTKEGLLRN